MSIVQVRHGDPRLAAFIFRDNLAKEDVKRMADVLNSKFDETDEAVVLLDFRALDGIDFDAMASFSATKAQFRSLSNVSCYAVIDPPTAAGAMIEFFDTLIPADSRVFDAHQADAAWRFVEKC